MRFARLLAAYRHAFHDHRRERLFLSSLAFFLTFGVARLVTFSARQGLTPDLYIRYRGTHVHHLVPGILLLLAAGYGWLLMAGPQGRAITPRVGRALALVYGIGSALTLDEFALWLNLEDVYWEEQGRASIDAVMLFGALISAGLWGGPFLRTLGRQFARLGRLARARREP